MECIEIKVRKDTAEKWCKTSPEKRARIERKISQELSKNLLDDSSKTPIKKEWKSLGSVVLGGKADTLNIRDIAHDD